MPPLPLIDRLSVGQTAGEAVKERPPHPYFVFAIVGDVGLL
jgi:hypothetical protein